MEGLDSSFQDLGNKYMPEEALEEYVLASIETSFKDTGQHAPMRFMPSAEEFHESRNDSNWLYQK